jgi:hypothetical protein
VDEGNLPLRLLEQSGKSGWSYAHVLALNGTIFTRKEVLVLADERGVSVAHVQASKGYVFSDPEILALKTNTGLSVEDYRLDRLAI